MSEIFLKAFNMSVSAAWAALAVLLSIYWFNPMLWLTFRLLCGDIELACDERVISSLGEQAKKPYSEALINCSVPSRRLAACPLAFGEMGVKQRIKNVLNHKKPTIWIIIASFALTAAAAVCLLTNPRDNTLKTIEHLSLKNSFEQTDILLLGDGESFKSAENYNSALLKRLSDIKISQREISKSRSEDRDKSNCVVIHDRSEDAMASIYSYVPGFCICFNEDFTEVWVQNDVKPTLSYRVKNPKEAEEIYTDLYAYTEKSSYDAPAASSEKTPIIYKSAAEHGTASLMLYPESKKCSFSLSVLSSYWPHGSYEETSTQIIMSCDENVKYTFKKQGDDLIFDAKNSKFRYSVSGSPESSLEDGAVFKKTSY